MSPCDCPPSVYGWVGADYSSLGLTGLEMERNCMQELYLMDYNQGLLTPVPDLAFFFFFSFGHAARLVRS